MELAPLIHRFFDNIRNRSDEVYNEFSLQHELGIFLRRTVEPDCKIQFERPVSFFNLPRRQFVKKEIDIAVFNSPPTIRQSIELKYPSNGQYPEQMYKACEDILFLEQLVAAGFERCYFIMFAEDRLFFQGPTTTGIYSYFRASAPIHGRIPKPTGGTGKSLEITGSYLIRWHDITKDTRYGIVEVTK